MKAERKSHVWTHGSGGAALTLGRALSFTALLTDRFLSPLDLTNILVQSSIMAVIAMTSAAASTSSLWASWRCRAASPAWRSALRHLHAGVVRRHHRGTAVDLANGIVVAKLRVNPFIAALFGGMVLVRGVVYIITAARR